MAEQNQTMKLDPKIVVAACVFYILSPIDLVPDVILVLGWLDDLGVLGFLIHYLRTYKKGSMAPLHHDAEAPECTVIDIPAKMLECRDP